MLKHGRLRIFALLTILSLFMVSGVFAKVTSEEAAQLGKSLTPLGGEMAGNADGTIPAWDGGITGIPEGITFKPGDFHPDPFTADKVLYKVTAQNMDQYKDKLTKLNKELLKKFPETYYLNIYQTRRTAAAPEWVYKRTKRNATVMEMTEDKLGVVNHGLTGGIPFPIPKSGEEAIYNHLLRWRGIGRSGDYKRANIFPNGTLSRSGGGKVSEKYTWNIEDLDSANWNGVYYNILVEYELPARRKGEFIILRDYINASEQSRMAWQYLPGQRRVRRAPTVGNDTPHPGSSGLETYDDTFTFLGQIDRFDWKIVGKKEIFIPYNCYQNDLVPEMDLLTPNHPSPEVLRYELHRVWVVESTLKEGKRHVYGRRTFYLDEDTWVAVASDIYDIRGNFYRGHIAPMKNKYNLPACSQISEFAFDFTRSDYAVNANVNGLERNVRNDIFVEDSVFTPQNLRRIGRR